MSFNDDFFDILNNGIEDLDNLKNNNEKNNDINNSNTKSQFYNILNYDYTKCDKDLLETFNHNVKTRKQLEYKIEKAKGRIESLCSQYSIDLTLYKKELDRIYKSLKSIPRELDTFDFERKVEELKFELDTNLANVEKYIEQRDDIKKQTDALKKAFKNIDYHNLNDKIKNHMDLDVIELSDEDVSKHAKSILKHSSNNLNVAMSLLAAQKGVEKLSDRSTEKIKELIEKELKSEKDTVINLKSAVRESTVHNPYKYGDER